MVQSPYTLLHLPSNLAIAVESAVIAWRVVQVSCQTSASPACLVIGAMREVIPSSDFPTPLEKCLLTVPWAAE